MQLKGHSLSRNGQTDFSFALPSKLGIACSWGFTM